MFFCHFAQRRYLLSSFFCLPGNTGRKLASKEKLIFLSFKIKTFLPPFFYLSKKTERKKKIKFLMKVLQAFQKVNCCNVIIYFPSIATCSFGLLGLGRAFFSILRNGSLYGESLHVHLTKDASLLSGLRFFEDVAKRCERDIHFTDRLWILACRRTVPVATGPASLFLEFCLVALFHPLSFPLW